MTFDTIVIGMDFSDTAIKAAKWASEQFAPGATIILVHVFDPPDQPPFGRHLLPAPADIEAEAREYAATRLHEVATFLSPETPRCEVRVGKPYEQITAAAREMGADLIVVGPHGDRPRPSKFLGTTAERIVRTSPVPVLVATNPPVGRPRTLLVPVDDISVTPTLLARTRDLAADFDADVTLLHVWSNAVYSHVASMSYAAKANEAEAREDITNELRDAGLHWLREIARTGIDRDRVSAAVTHGKPGDATIELATAMHADLIVLGRRGTGLVAPALLGSTVGTVLHGSPCPVLVITEPADVSAT
ncbi:MAG TPA: universal stress protein [Gemmatimonadaceae bacterium]